LLANPSSKKSWNLHNDREISANPPKQAKLHYRIFRPVRMTAKFAQAGQKTCLKNLLSDTFTQQHNTMQGKILLVLACIVIALIPCICAEEQSKEFNLRPGFDEEVTASVVCGAIVFFICNSIDFGF
jgi:hypothetical protein